MRRDALLDAAETLLCQHGTQALTLSAVAAGAGISKGGLLYHFPTKEALVSGLVERLIDEYDALIAECSAGSPGSYTRAFVEATFEVVTDGDQSRALRRWAAVCAATTAPEMLTPLRTAMRRWHRRDPGDDPDPVAAQVARLAAEGLWEVAMHDPDIYDKAQLTALRDRLLGLL